MREFLADAGVMAKHFVDAKKQVLGSADAAEMLKSADHVYIAKGKNTVHFDLKKDRQEEIVPLMLGPARNLRALLVRKGRTISVGFEKAMHRAVREHGS